jgi:hypothetical protein
VLVSYLDAELAAAALASLVSQGSSLEGARHVIPTLLGSVISVSDPQLPNYNSYLTAALHA